MAKLERTTFKTSRAAQYLETRALTSMTGQAVGRFADVVAKELMDNALDACETAGVAPEVTLAVGYEDDKSLYITVSDNAGGIPSDTVHAALDFNVLVSDKAAYRSPTRGAQGNALKTVFGIPYALGSLEPVVVEAKGTRHDVRVWKDLGGELRVQCDDTDRSEPSDAVGTAITAHVPMKGWDDYSYLERFDPEYWARAFSLFNPHAEVRIRRFGVGSHHGKSKGPFSEDSYKPTRDPAKRFKYLPSDLTSPHWYDPDTFKRLVGSYIGHALHEGGEDLPLGAFVRKFKGLSATRKAKMVTAAFPDIKMLSDFEGSPEEVHELLEVMQHHSDAPSHTTFGYVGREHFKQRFEEYYRGDLQSFRYKKITGTLPTGMPYVFEFAIAELDSWTSGGDLFTAVNFSPTFGDPLADVRFYSPKIVATGVEGFLEEGFAHPRTEALDDPDPPKMAVAVHVITPAPLFLDQGKTLLEGFDHHSVGAEIGKAMFSKVRPFYTAGNRRLRGQLAEERAEERSQANAMPLTEATAAVLEEAWKHTTGNGKLPVGVRRLFYRVRSMIPSLTTTRFNPDSGYKYFSGRLLPDYQDARVAAGKERLPNIYYDPRGKLHEPHGGDTVDLGTREVEAYQFPDYVFDKLLYVEKKGQFPLLKAARFMERYDMGIVTGEGFSTVAARTLMQTAQQGQKYQIFVLHDADHSGYNIARTVSEETARMPGYSIEVHDLGLTVEQALEKGMESEEFVRSSSLPKGLEPTLAEGSIAREWFVGEHIKEKKYRCKRVELDDMSAPEAVRHVEAQLAAKGVRPKVIPPPPVLTEEGQQMYRTKVNGWVDEIIDELLSVEDLKARLAKEFEERFKLQGARAWIEGPLGFKGDDTRSWRDALTGTLQAAYEGKHKASLNDAVREYIQKTVASDASGANAVEDE
jgi:hypothetical protein